MTKRKKQINYNISNTKVCSTTQMFKHNLVQTTCEKHEFGASGSLFSNGLNGSGVSGRWVWLVYCIPFAGLKQAKWPFDWLLQRGSLMAWTIPSFSFGTGAPVGSYMYTSIPHKYKFILYISKREFLNIYLS